MNLIKPKNVSCTKQSLLSTLWIFVLFNYLYCDVLSNMEAETLNGLLTGHIAGMEITPFFMLGAAILMEIPTLMVLLSRILPHKGNRRANIIAGLIMTSVQTGSLFVGTGPSLHYVFYSAIEITCTAVIIWLAWRWPDPEIA
ncbi:MAG: hypothetical protein GX577_02175 [Leptolinea sp.]|nr:hypothetical protein [Leptolinea sp.]